jgi:hypothetical protein
MDKKYIFSERAVAFLDVLGFKNKLQEFEKEAIEFKNLSSAEIAELDEDFEGGVYYSKKANEFIQAFESAISKLDKDKFSYYLFSDNICITAKNVIEGNEGSLTELLLVISELYFEFIQRGYFLRGAIDYGLFIDKSAIALGLPSAVAYSLESSKAVFPRIVLSENFVSQFSQISLTGQEEINSVFEDSLIKKSCEINYLNVFNHVFKLDDKEYFFENYNRYILQNLNDNKSSETVFIKFKWLAEEFNNFIDQFTSDLAYRDVNNDPEEDFIIKVKSLKIGYGQ